MPDYRQIIDAETWNFIDKTNRFYPVDTYTKTIDEQRRIYNEMCRAFYPEQPAKVVRNNTMAGHVPVRVYLPVGKASDVTVIYTHGGGFTVGGLDSHDDVCAEICEATGFHVVAVDYRLAPEFDLDYARQDCQAALDWVRKETLGQRIILVGDSAGGALAAMICHANRASVDIVGQVLIYPGLGGNGATGSMEKHAFAPLLTREEVLQNRELVDGVHAAPQSLINNPLLQSELELLPVSVALSAECDPISDDARDYVDLIKKAGGCAFWRVDTGLVHGHLRARHSAKRARQSFDRVLRIITMIGAGDVAFEPLVG